MATSTPTPGGAKTNLGLEPNIGALLCYVPCCIGLVFSVVVAIVEKESRFVRFHAFQSLLVHAVSLVVLGGLQVFSVVVGSFGLWAVGGLVWVVEVVALVALFAVLVLLMISANSGEEFTLPVLGTLAHRWA